MNQLEYGIYTDLPSDEYHADRKFLSSSALKVLLENPELFYRTYIKGEGQKKESAAFDVGTAIHLKILEPEKFDKEVAFYSGVKRGKIWEEFKSQNEGKLFLGDIAEMQIHRMDESIKKSSGIDFVTGGQSEVTVLVNLDGFDVKIRIDHLKIEKAMSDLKSCSGVITESSFQKTVERFQYDLSAALYVDAYYKATGIMLPFIWVASSKDFDDTKTFRATPEILEQGRQKYKKAFQLFRQYQSSNWNFSNTVIDLYPSKSDEFEFEAA